MISLLISAQHPEEGKKADILQILLLSWEHFPYIYSSS